MSLAQIAKVLNAEGVPSPQPARNRKHRAWRPTRGTVAGILENNILNREMAEYTVNAFQAELNKRLQDMAERSSEHQAGIEKLRAERDEVRAKAYRIGDAIATNGHSKTLMDMLATAESKIAEIERRIEAHCPDIKASVEEVRDYAYKALIDLKSLIRTVTQKAKIKLAQHVKELVMTPKQLDGEWVYEMTGE